MTPPFFTLVAIPPDALALLGPIVLDASLKAGVLLLFTCAVAALLRRASASLRHLIWSVGLTGVLVLPLFSVVVPAWRLPLLPSELVVSRTAPAAPVPAPTPVPTEQTVQTAQAAAEGPPSFVDRTEHPRTQIPLSSAAGAASSADGRLVGLLLWLTGTLLMLARLLVGVVRMRRLARRATPIRSGDWPELAATLMRRLGLRREVALLRGEAGTVPMTWGVLRPVVLLPREANEWSEERRRVVLLHELCHVQRRDALTQLVSSVVMALHWPNPLVWLAVRRLHEERERACDDQVLSAGTPSAEYAEHLLQIVRSFGNTTGPSPALAMARRSQFEGRLLAILDSRLRRGAAGRRGTAAITLGALCLVIPLAAVSPSARRVAADSGGEAAPSASVVSEVLPPRATIARQNQGRPAQAQFSAADFARRYGTDPALAAAILRAAQAEAVEPDLAFRLVRAESGFDEQRTSERGAVGLTQILPATAATLQPGLTADRLRDRNTNLRLGFRYLAVLLRAYDGNVVQALRAYHRGPGAVAQDRSGEDASRNAYVQHVLGDSLRESVQPPAPSELERVIRSIGSDGDRATLLIQALVQRPTDQATLGAVLRASESIGSDGDRARVLLAVISSAELEHPTQRQLLRSAAGIGSDGDKANVLIGFAQRYGVSDAVRAAFFEAVDRIESDSDARRVLSVVANQGDLSEATVRRLLNSAARLTSDGEKAGILTEIAGRGLISVSIRSHYLAVAETISLDSDKRYAIAVLLGVPAENEAAPKQPSDSRIVDESDATTDLHSTRTAEDGTTSTLTVRAKDVVLEANSFGIARILPNGFFFAEETRGGVVRTVRVRPAADGRLEHTYQVNGRVVPLDAEGRAWLATILRRTHQQMKGQKRL